MTACCVEPPRDDTMTSMPDTITTRPAPWALLLAVVIGGGFYLAGQHVAAMPRSIATISVSADSRVSALPDVAFSTFGITVERQNTAKGAIDGVRKNMTAIIAAVKNAGVEEKDIATENFWLSPSYDYADGRQILQGYSAGQSLRVKVRNLENVGAVLTAATNAGANQAGDVTFSFDNTDELQAKARTMAIAEAKQKAVQLAASLGVSLGKLQGFSEGYSGSPQPPMLMRDMAMMKTEMADQAPMPVPSGEQDITAQVTLTYELQ